VVSGTVGWLRLKLFHEHDAFYASALSVKEVLMLLSTAFKAIKTTSFSYQHAHAMVASEAEH